MKRTLTLCTGSVLSLFLAACSVSKNEITKGASMMPFNLEIVKNSRETILNSNPTVGRTDDGLL